MLFVYIIISFCYDYIIPRYGTARKSKIKKITKGHNIMSEQKKFPSIREAAARGPLSEHCLRLMLKQGTLPGVYSGKKFLVNYALLLEQLSAKGGCNK